MFSRRLLSITLILGLSLPSEGVARVVLKAPTLVRSSLVAPNSAVLPVGSLPLAMESVVPSLNGGMPTFAPVVLPGLESPALQQVKPAPLLPAENGKVQASITRQITKAEKVRPVVRESLVAVGEHLKKAPAKTMRRYFDAGHVKPGGPVSLGFSGSLVRRRSLLNPAVVAPAPKPEKTPDVPIRQATRKRGKFKTGVLIGAAATTGAAVWYGAFAPALAVNITLSIGAATTVLWAGNKFARWTLKRGPPKTRSLKKGFILGLLLATLVSTQPQMLMTSQFKALSATRRAWEAIAPKAWRGGDIDAVMEVVTETRDIHALPSEFGESVASVLEQNPEGRAVLEGLTDRGGTLRLPDFYIAEVGDGTAARYIAPYDAVFLGASYLDRLGITLEDIREDPAAARKLIASVETTLFHELFHANQFRRRLLVPGMLEQLPTQLHKVLALEIEYETHIAEQRYVHEKLKADPSAELPYYALSEYESFLRDINQFLGGIDEAYAYRWFSSINSKYYRGVLARERAMHDARAVEGYLNLSRRASVESEGRGNYYFEKAKDRAEKAGLSIPKKPF